MARTYRNTPENKQNTKRRKSKKNKASWKAFREQHRHAKQMDALPTHECRQRGVSWMTTPNPIKLISTDNESKTKQNKKENQEMNKMANANTKKQRNDNKSNQMNPNNWRYHKARENNN